MNATTDWEAGVTRHREEKDRYLGEHPHSPLPPDERGAFDGLEYYPPDPEYRFEVVLEEHDEKETVTVETTTDGARDFLRWGAFRFEVGGEPRTLHAFKANPDEDHLWVPFRDATSGEETYGAGRYLDLEATDRTDDGRWVLDFNYAYNPFCAYSAAYECPLVPMENWLDARIEAGERTYRSPAGYDAA